jgi:2-oxoisovalerate dehydrogenase E1 component beta subunit
VHGGPFHSQNVEAYFFHTPGLKIVEPATPYDAKGLIKAAIRDDDPVLYFEHKYLYRRIRGEVPEDDYIVPIGKADVKRPGRDVTVLTYGWMLHKSLEAADLVAAEGIEVEVVDLRTLLPLDDETILSSVAKTGRAVIVHEDTRTGGIAGEIAMRINERIFEYLEAPVVRVTAPDTPIPFSPPLEEFFLPQVEEIVQAIRWVANY